MLFDKRISSAHKRLLSQPVSRLLILCFILIALLPMAFFGYTLYQAAWENAWREINEKHRLLAENLAAPITIYINDHKNFLGATADTIREQSFNNATDEQYRTSLINTLHRIKGFRSLALVGTDGVTRVIVHADDIKPNARDVFAHEACYLTTRKTGQPALSKIKPSPVNRNPTLIQSQPIKDKQGKLIAVLLGELRIELIDKLRNNIRFGKGGHSAIVDQTGHVIAHPNPQWMEDMHDLSGLPVVQAMMAGKTGVTEFYSPATEEQMVAGYASVPDIGWGVMVPQPKSEIDEQVYALLYSHMLWGIAGLMVAILLVIPLIRGITGPINQLASAAERLSHDDFEGELPETSKNAPREIRQLGAALRNMVSGLQKSKLVVNELNMSMQARVHEATQQLREANARLEQLSQQDHLTELANRRHFENMLAETIDRRVSETGHLCIMLIDVDNFKDINDKYGHAAGDSVLMKVADLLKNAMRPDDLAARYGGDEFVVRMRCDPKVGLSRAQDILSTIEHMHFKWHDDEVHITVSIGLLQWKLDDSVDMETLLSKADAAMYQAKRLGRNKLVEVKGTQSAASGSG